MDARLLFYSDPTLSPEARWLLLQWSGAVGLDKALTCSLRELYRRLGISPQHTKPVLEKLNSQGHIIYETVRHGRGRPVSSHLVSPAFLHCLEMMKVPVVVHQPEIKELGYHAVAVRALHKQEGKGLMSGEQRATMLTPATYWLFAVLLAHADTPGIVTGLSYGRLRAITGMTKERLKSQLSKLKKLGIISRYEPGVLRSQDGASMRSVYFLDLAHPLLMGKDSCGLSVVFNSTGQPEKMNFLSGFYDAALVVSEMVENAERIREKKEEACVVDVDKEDHGALWESMRMKGRYANAYKRLLQNTRSLLPPLRLLEPAASEFLELHRLGMESILKAHIRSYAMMLLSNHWVDLEHGRGKSGDPIGTVLTAIMRDCSSLAMVHDNQDEAAFYTFIYALSHHLAVKLYYVLKLVEQQQSDCDFAAAAFSLEPFNHQEYEYWRLDVHFRPSDGVTYLNNVLVGIPSFSLSLPVEFDVLAGEETE